MGMIRDVKAQTVARDAANARAAGRQVLAVKLNYPGFKPDFSGEVEDWSVMIQAVEEQGWALYNFAGISDPKGRPEAICLFRPR